MADMIQLIKERNPLEEVIADTMAMGSKRGRHVRGVQHDSLVVDVMAQLYTWYSRAEAGDVINWVQNREGVEFQTAVEILARRAGLPAPEWSQKSAQERVEARKRINVYTAARYVLTKALEDTREALAYATGRGWTKDTIKAAHLGYAGPGVAKELRGVLNMNEIDLTSVEAVALLGYRPKSPAGLEKWAAEHNLDIHTNWIEWGYIPGLVGSKKRLVYTHLWGGQVRYFSGRNILGSEKTKEGREIKSYNLARILAGPRQLYYNQEYKPGAKDLFIVEGQADAITLGQWGYAAVALAGVSYEDHREVLKKLKEKHNQIYIGVDNDQAGIVALRGKNNTWPLAHIMGPDIRIVQWSL